MNASSFTWSSSVLPSSEPSRWQHSSWLLSALQLEGCPTHHPQDLCSSSPCRRLRSLFPQRHRRCQQQPTPVRAEKKYILHNEGFVREQCVKAKGCKLANTFVKSEFDVSQVPTRRHKTQTWPMYYRPHPHLMVCIEYVNSKLQTVLSCWSASIVLIVFLLLLSNRQHCLFVFFIFPRRW